MAQQAINARARGTSPSFGLACSPNAMQSLLILTHEFPPYLGGIATVAQGLATGAAALGYDTHVLAPAYDGETEAWDAEQPYSIARFPGASCSLVSIDKLLRFTARVRRELARRDAEIVHAVDPPAQMALTALSRPRLARRYFFTVHGSELLRYRDDPLPRFWMRGAFKKVTAGSVVSREVLELLLDEFEDADEERFFVSHPGIAPRWLATPACDRASVRARWSVSDDDLVLLTVARRVPEKGHTWVIDGLARLPSPLRQRTLYVVVGPGPEDYARTLADRARSGAVRLLMLGGLADDSLVEVYDAADVFVMLSRQHPKRLEGFGLVYLEAAARGVPAIASATGGVAEAVLDGETGILVPDQPTGDQVASAIVRLARDTELRSALGRRARERAESFTWRSCAADVYERFSRA